jgi:hypothetical protein
LDQHSAAVAPRQVLLHDLATPKVEPLLQGLLRTAEAEFDVEAAENGNGKGDRDTWETGDLYGISI